MTSPNAAERAGGPRRALLVTALAGAVALAWAAVVFVPVGMDVGAPVFVAAWTIMMIAMMLPSASPLVLLYARGASTTATTAMVAGYVTTWAAAGIPAYLAGKYVPMTAGPFVLAAAGIYQLTPLKTACLSRCNSPADFLVRRWGKPPLLLGLEHGLWCIGCCWGLMAVLVLAGGMGLAWVVGIAAIVALEKLSPRGSRWPRLIGAALLAAALMQGVMLWRGNSMDMSWSPATATTAALATSTRGPAAGNARVAGSG